MDPVGLAFVPGDRLALVADSGVDGGVGQAALYRFPAGSVVKSYTDPNFGGYIFGAAINPTEQFGLH